MTTRAAAKGQHLRFDLPVEVEPPVPAVVPHQDSGKPARSMPLVEPLAVPSTGMSLQDYNSTTLFALVRRAITMLEKRTLEPEGITSKHALYLTGAG
jgi:hypothetical protein